MRFYSPEALWFLLLIVAAAVAWSLLERKSKLHLEKFASSEVLSKLLQGVDFKKRRRRFVLTLVAMTLAIVAMARPQMGSREESLQSEGLDLVFLLDVSNSMLAEDAIPNRMKKAKHIIKNFLDRLSGDRVGVIAFAGSAYPAVPLTTDYEFIRQTLEILDEGSIANQGSDVAKAIETGIGLLLRGGAGEEGVDASLEEATNGSRAIVLLTDGESHEGEESKLVAKLKEKNIRVYSIGVGSLKGAPIPIRDQTGYMRGYKKDQSGNMILTKLESGNLEPLANKTGGKFYAASSNEGEIEEILSELSSMDRSEGVERRVVVYDEVYQYPLFLGVLLLLLALVLNEKRAVGAAAILFVLASGGQAKATNSLREYSHTKNGIGAYQAEDYASAAQSFGKAQVLDPDNPKHRINLGDALLKSQSPESAIPEFKAVAKNPDANIAAKGAFNLGKAYEAQKKHEDAIRAYQDALLRLADSEKPDPEAEQRLKRALEKAQQNKQQQSQEGDQGEPDKQGKGNPNGDPKNDQKDGKDNKDKKPYGISKEKPKFKQEKLGEADAKKILQQLQEAEKKSQKRMMQGKTQKTKSDKNGNDW